MRNCPVTGWVAKIVYFFWVIPYGGEKTHKQTPPPKKSRDNPVKMLFIQWFEKVPFGRGALYAGVAKGPLPDPQH